MIVTDESAFAAARRENMRLRAILPTIVRMQAKHHLRAPWLPAFANDEGWFA